MLNYFPMVIGCSHSREMLWDVLHEIETVRPESVGVEISKFALENHKLIGLNPSAIDFWKTLIRQLERQRIQVIHLVDDSLAKQIIAEQEKLLAKGITAKMVLESPTKHPEGKRLLELMRDKVTSTIELTTRKRMPRLIVAGFFHGNILQENLRLPKRQFKVHLVPSRRAQNAMGIKLSRTAVAKRQRELTRKARFHTNEHRRNGK